MNFKLHALKACLVSTLSLTAALFFLTATASATKPLPDEQAPIAEAPAEKGAAPDAQTMAASASGGSGISPLGTEFYEAGASIIEASNHINQAGFLPWTP